jgi:hypothetical protein
MEHNQNENTTAEVVASQDAQAFAAYTANLEMTMNTLKFTIEHQVKTYELVRLRNPDRFKALEIPALTGIQFADLKSFIVDWESDNRYSFDDQIEENVSCKLEIDTDWGEESCRIEIVKSVDSGDILPDIIGSLIGALEEQFNG